MTNHMEEVAKLLGVELEEEFRITGFPDGGICNICAHDVNCMYDKTLKCNNGIAIWLKQEYTGVSDYD